MALDDVLSATEHIGLIAPENPSLYMMLDAVGRGLRGFWHLFLGRERPEVDLPEAPESR